MEFRFEDVYLYNDVAEKSRLAGLITVHELENNVRPSYERKETVAWKDVQWLKRKTDAAWANLPGEHAWLRDWECVCKPPGREDVATT